MNIFWRLITVAYLLGGIHFLAKALDNSNLSIAICFFVLSIIMVIVIIGEKIEEAIQENTREVKKLEKK